MKRREFLSMASSLGAVLLPGYAHSQSRPCPPPLLQIDGQAVTSTCSSTNAEADWQRRTSGPGVVWFHDFRAEDEVNNFRWTPGYRGGNDPLAVGSSLAPLVRRNTSDGITGGGCLEIVRPSGSSDGSHWWRPFSPMIGGRTGNGRTQDDPGAGGVLAAQDYAATDGGSQISSWGDRGYYGTAGPGPFDGREYYFQARVKIDPRRIQGDNASIDVGKLFYFTITDFSASQQEIVVYSSGRVSNNNYLRMYRSVGPPLDQDSPGVGVHGNQPGTQFGSVGDGVCRLDDDGGRLTNCWHWPENDWATVMWHIRPGTHSGNDTLVEVFVAGPGETEYTRIWHQPGVDLPFSGDPQGHNAVICSVYHNGLNMSEFWHRYDQLIFSREFIPCPQV